MVTGGVPGEVKVKVVVLIVAGFIASLKVATSSVLGQMPTARLVGATETTVGIHATVAVVKFHMELVVIATPDKSVAPVLIMAV
jgi:hypothetical protein